MLKKIIYIYIYIYVYLLTKYIKSVLCGVAARLSYIYDAWCLQFNPLALELDIYSLAHHLFKCEYFMNQEA